MIPAKRFRADWATIGRSVLAYQSTDYCGLYSLNGTVIAPRVNKPSREKPNTAGERGPGPYRQCSLLLRFPTRLRKQRSL